MILFENRFFAYTTKVKTEMRSGWALNPMKEIEKDIQIFRDKGHVKTEADWGDVCQECQEPPKAGRG